MLIALISSVNFRLKLEKKKNVITLRCRRKETFLFVGYETALISCIQRALLSHVCVRVCDQADGSNDWMIKNECICHELNAHFEAGGVTLYIQFPIAFQKKIMKKNKNYK